MARATRDMLDEVTGELQMTPMIDVTFLLLVFGVYHDLLQPGAQDEGLSPRDRA
jgi:biopolymer transport protein ExbD